MHISDRLLCISTTANAYLQTMLLTTPSRGSYKHITCVRQIRRSAPGNLHHMLHIPELASSLLPLHPGLTAGLGALALAALSEAWACSRSALRQQLPSGLPAERPHSFVSPAQHWREQAYRDTQEDSLRRVISFHFHLYVCLSVLCVHLCYRL